MRDFFTQMFGTAALALFPITAIHGVEPQYSSEPEPKLFVRDPWYALIVGGLSGSGKSIAAQEIDRKLSLPVIDADDYHSRAVVEWMKNGTALTAHVFLRATGYK